jgi:2-C-methyl-D-erythritol 2,4-cyclodiphosphate synthase
VSDTEFRCGIGYDSHRFETGGPVILGGVSIPANVHLVGHSDGDAVCHAVIDAILGGAGAGDVGALFPDTDAANKGRDSVEMLAKAVARVNESGWRISNVDITVITQHPRLAPYREQMRERLASAIGIAPDRVSIKGKTNEGMGWIGRSEGLACVAVASLTRPA